MSKFLSGKVKNVLSGDTLVLVPPSSPQVPIPERVLTLQYVRAESYQAREFLRQLVIGKVVKFKVLFELPTTGKQFGDVQAPIFPSLIEYMVKNGWAKLKENIKADSDEEESFVDNLRQLELTAQRDAVGVWSPSFKDIPVVQLDDAIKERSQKNPLPLVVEKVISGDRIVARLIVNPNNHVLQPMILAGLKAPRTDDLEPSTVKVAHQAKQYVEDHLLTTKAALKATIVGESNTGVPLVLVEHPSGNSIHEKLLENGFAEIVDWQSTLIGSTAMSGYRKAEQTAKALGKGIFASVTAKPASAPAAGGASSKNLRPGATIESVTISKVITVDTYNVRLPSGEEITIQLASLRGPRPNDTTVTTNPNDQQALVQMAKEYCRNLTVGKTASMFIDGFRPANNDLNLDERFLVSLKINSKDVSEAIVSNGYASIIRHNKQTSGERSMNWDKLIELEEEQKKLGKKGIYYKGDISKILTIGTRIVNASENGTKSRTFFSGFSKKGRISGFHVEYIPSVNRVRLYNPREGTKLTLVLGGLSNDRSSESGNAGLDYMNKKYLQRNVEFEVYDTDKVGGFIGNLFANSQSLKPVQIELLSAGLASVHEIALSSNSFGSDFEAAQRSAQESKKGVWTNYDAAKEQQAADQASAQLAQINLENIKPKFFDIEVVDIDDEGVFSFHKADAQTSAQFATFKQNFNAFHAQNPSASAASVDLPINLTKPPKKNDYVSAKYGDAGKYYRAKVQNIDRNTNKIYVKHIDFGNVDKVSLRDLRALPLKFSVSVIPPFAHTFQLKDITLPPTVPTDYLSDALGLLEDLTFDKKLVLSGYPSARGVEYDAVLYDSEKSLSDPEYTINSELVAKGYGLVNQRGSGEDVAKLAKIEAKARRSRLGCWEFGDIRPEED